jgi:hypothetical protein
MSEPARVHETIDPDDLDDASPLERRGALGSRAHIRRMLGRTGVPLALVDPSGDDQPASLAFRAQLRASVTAYVRRLRAERVPPQRMLVLVKSVVREGAPTELEAIDARDLMSAVVRWSIEAYYAT